MNAKSRCPRTSLAISFVTMSDAKSSPARRLPTAAVTTRDRAGTRKWPRSRRSLRDRAQRERRETADGQEGDEEGAGAREPDAGRAGGEQEHELPPRGPLGVRLGQDEEEGDEDREEDDLPLPDATDEEVAERAVLLCGHEQEDHRRREGEADHRGAPVPEEAPDRKHAQAVATGAASR